MQTDTDRQNTIADLRSKLHQDVLVREAISTGHPELDELLPAGGLRRGSLIEWVGRGPASGAGTLSLFLAQQIPKSGPRIVIDPDRQVYPLPLLAAGGEPAAWIFARARDHAEGLWAFEQALRCPGVSLVWARIDPISPVAFRRLQIAVESSGGLGFLVRPETALKQPSWAEARFLVSPRPSLSESPRFQIEVAYSRGPVKRSNLDIEIDTQTGRMTPPRFESSDRIQKTKTWANTIRIA